ncbi:hypothetical protein [Streptomyces sp. NPDC005799]|uniref:hypothetical protein n=1 Tax=Streptomyces sp. NPDC005799 TaxID=3154678 RepID=UPI0033E2540A
MALRFTVQGDDEAETAEGLRMLLSLGLETKMPPRDMISNGWMARAVQRPTPADTTEPQT